MHTQSQPEDSSRAEEGTAALRSQAGGAVPRPRTATGERRGGPGSGGTQDRTRPWEGTWGPHEVGTVSPLRQEGQEWGLMAVPQNSKTMRDSLALQRAAK